MSSFVFSGKKEEQEGELKATDYSDKSPAEKFCQGHGAGKELQTYLHGKDNHKKSFLVVESIKMQHIYLPF